MFRCCCRGGYRFKQAPRTVGLDALMDTLDALPIFNCNDLKSLGYCYCYTLCWRSEETKGYPTRWLSQRYSLKKEAKKEARKLRAKYGSAKPKPYIIRTIVSRLYFKEDAQVEDVPLIDALKYEQQEKYIGY